MRWMRSRRSAGGGWQKVEGELGGPASLVLAFVHSEAREPATWMRELSELHPGAVVAGCSTGTWIGGAELQDQDACALAIEFEHTRVRAACEAVTGPGDSSRAGQELARQLVGEDLSLVWILSDGLAVNGTGLVAGLSQGLGPQVTIVGGLAGDGARFQSTWTSLGDGPRAQQVVAIGLYGKRLRHSVSAVGGWDTFGPRRVVTRANGSTLYELDGQPALDLYERYLGEEAAKLPGSALLFPLQVWASGEQAPPVVRTVLGVDQEDRSMTFAGDIPQGAVAQLMRGHHERLVDGAEAAASAAAGQLARPPGPGAVALLVSCVGRRLLMQQRTHDEVDVVQRTLGPGVGVAGFYSYGELAPQRNGAPCDLHNQTMTVTVLAEE